MRVFLAIVTCLISLSCSKLQTNNTTIDSGLTKANGSETNIHAKVSDPAAIESANKIIKEFEEKSLRQLYLMMTITSNEALKSNQHTNFHVSDSLYKLIDSLQESKISINDISKSSFFFDDPVGQDLPGRAGDKYFECVEVSPLHEDESHTKIAAYKALYVNLDFNIPVEVTWFGTQPLIGQKLNSDFLICTGANTYMTIENQERTKINFIWPIWAVKNGYYPDELAQEYRNRLNNKQE
ncbi:hypothetical protein DSECCO2_626190 [anaerobic digester metagenome]